MDKTIEAAGTVDSLDVLAHCKVYWCPRCKVQSERAWHFCAKGPPLIPQLDTETKCEEIPLAPLAGAVDLVRALGSAWRTNDDEAISNALAQLEDWAGLREQGSQ